MPSVETITPRETDNAWLADAFERRPTKRRNLTIPEYAETTVIPAGKYRGVKFRNDRAPYMIRPMEVMSPNSNIQEARLMWPAQTGKTTVAENVIMQEAQFQPEQSIPPHFLTQLFLILTVVRLLYLLLLRIAKRLLYHVLSPCAYSL